MINIKAVLLNTLSAVGGGLQAYGGMEQFAFGGAEEYLSGGTLTPLAVIKMVEGGANIFDGTVRMGLAAAKIVMVATNEFSGKAKDEKDKREKEILSLPNNFGGVIGSVGGEKGQAIGDAANNGISAILGACAMGESISEGTGRLKIVIGVAISEASMMADAFSTADDIITIIGSESEEE
jgi:hypothetical protein